MSVIRTDRVFLPGKNMEFEATREGTSILAIGIRVLCDDGVVVPRNLSNAIRANPLQMISGLIH